MTLIPRHEYECDISPRSLIRLFAQKVLHLAARVTVFPGARTMLYRLQGVHIASHVFIGMDTWLDDQFPELISIEDGVTISFRVTIVAHDDARTSSGMRAGLGSGIVAPVRLGKGCYIGTGAIILPGVYIGEEAVVGAGAVVTNSIPPRTVAVGVPARVIKRMDSL